MKLPASPLRKRSRAGITLLELAVVMSVLLSLTSVTFVGARAWRTGADRASCVMNVRNIQMSVRSYQNVYGYDYGTMPYADGGTQSIADHLYRKGYITPETFQTLKGDRTCAGGGIYDVPHEDVFPLVGTLYASCSLNIFRQHRLDGPDEW